MMQMSQTQAKEERRRIRTLTGCEIYRWSPKPVQLINEGDKKKPRLNVSVAKESSATFGGSRGTGQHYREDVRRRSKWQVRRENSTETYILKHEKLQPKSASSLTFPLGILIKNSSAEDWRKTTTQERQDERATSRHRCSSFEAVNSWSRKEQAIRKGVKAMHYSEDTSNGYRRGRRFQYSSQATMESTSTQLGQRLERIRKI